MYRARIGIIAKVIVGIAAVFQVITGGVLFALGRFSLPAGASGTEMSKIELPAKILDFALLGLPCLTMLFIVIFIVLRYFFLACIVLVLTFLQFLALQVKLTVFIGVNSITLGFITVFEDYSTRFIKGAKPLLYAHSQKVSLFQDLYRKHEEAMKKMAEMTKSQDDLAAITIRSTLAAIVGVVFGILVFSFVNIEYTESRQKEKELAEFASIKEDLTVTSKSEGGSPKHGAKTPNTGETPTTANTPKSAE